MCFTRIKFKLAFCDLIKCICNLKCVFKMLYFKGTVGEITINRGAYPIPEGT